MSPLVTRPAPPHVELRAERLDRASVRQGLAERLTHLRASALVFSLAYLVYAAAGLYATLQLGLVVGDAESRLAHAFFAWWNDPPKLTAIGFYWPPLQTIVLLPLAAIPPLATSLVALPLTSALFGAALLLVLERAFAGAGVRRALRWPIVLAFGLNPLIGFYAINGMSESLSLFFVALVAWLFVRWSWTPRWQDMALLGTALALATLTRYETGLAIVPIGACVVVALLRNRAVVSAIEASLLALMVPVLYALLLWAFLNSTIAGDPLFFLRAGAPPELPPDPSFDSAPRLLLDAIGIQLAIFPLTLVTIIALGAVAVRRRSPVALTLAVLTSLNMATTFALLLAAREGYLLELRYNMRAMPVALIGCAWLLSLASARGRTVGAAALLAALVASIPITGRTMLHHDQSVGERISNDAPRTRFASGAAAFVRATLLDDGALRELPPVGTGVELDAERAMASYIRERVAGRNVILTDDATTFGVMLADGHPERYLDRIDVGDERWLEILADPRGRASYVLASVAVSKPDRVVLQYPGLASGRPPDFLRQVHREGSYALYRVVR